MSKYLNWGYREIINGYIVAVTMTDGTVVEHFVEQEIDAINSVVQSTKEYYKKVGQKLYEKIPEKFHKDSGLDQFDIDLSNYNPRREI